MQFLPVLDSYAAMVCYLLGAVLCVGSALWIMRFGDRERKDRAATLAVCGAMAFWSIVSVAYPQNAAAQELAATIRNITLIVVIYRLFAIDGRDESLKPIRPVAIALGLVQLIQPVLLIVNSQAGSNFHVAQIIFEVALVLNMLVAVGALMLLHNLYAGATALSRKMIRWSGFGFTAIFAYDLNLFTLSYLSGEFPAGLIAARGLLCGIAAGLLALGAHSSSAELNFRPSRAVAFQTLSLLVIGLYFLVMVLVTRSLSLIGGDLARASQILFVVLAAIAALIWLPSQRLRGWLRVTAIKHLFQHRYDYREEWLRFTRTIGHVSGTGASFHERALKAIADITESPAALLLMPNEDAELELTARWNWTTLEIPAIAGDRQFAAMFEQNSHILDIEEVRQGIDRHGEQELVPEWLRAAHDAWAMVPLVHFDRLVGAIVLAHPRIERRLDWEDFDLLRVVGQQLASYLAEQAGQQALMESSRFDEFNRRMAFVMHDIKNLASQLSLLSANAQKHADNPDFRADMLVTLRSSSDKLNALLARLNRYGSGKSGEAHPVELSTLVKDISERFKNVHPIEVSHAERVEIMADRESLEQALIHLVQNAIDASEPDETVFLNALSDGFSGKVEVIDDGMGMSPEFVRHGLFKPFVSSKQDGFGIGAFEAREMVKAMGGRVTVESREGIGTRFAVTFPAAQVSQVIAQSVYRPPDATNFNQEEVA